MELIGGASRRIAAPWRSISRPDKRRVAPLIDDAYRLGGVLSPSRVEQFVSDNY